MYLHNLLNLKKYNNKLIIFKLKLNYYYYTLLILIAIVNKSNF